MSPTIRSAPEQIASAIYAAILDGSLAPGTWLPSEDDLAHAFAVSRPTVRAAMRRLRANGVIRSSRGRGGGTMVVGVGPRTMTVASREHIDLALGGQQVTNEQLREVRYELELLSAASAAKHRTDADLHALSRNEAMRPGTPGVPVSMDTALHYDLAFHRILARSSHNPIVSSFVAAAIITYRSFDLGDEHRTPAQIVAHIGDVIAAVRMRDAEGARAAMERHLQVLGGPCRSCPLPCEPTSMTANCRI